MDTHLPQLPGRSARGETFAGPDGDPLRSARCTRARPVLRRGPRHGCRLCGECLLGCPYGARTSPHPQTTCISPGIRGPRSAPSRVTSVRPWGAGCVVGPHSTWRRGRPATRPLVGGARRAVLGATGSIAAGTSWAPCRTCRTSWASTSHQLEALTAVLHAARQDLEVRRSRATSTRHDPRDPEPPHPSGWRACARSSVRWSTTTSGHGDSRRRAWARWASDLAQAG